MSVTSVSRHMCTSGSIYLLDERASAIQRSSVEGVVCSPEHGKVFGENRERNKMTAYYRDCSVDTGRLMQPVAG